MRLVKCYLYKIKLNYNKNKLVQQSSFCASINCSQQRTTVAAIDSAASNNYFPASYIGEDHCSTQGMMSDIVGTANGSNMESVASNRYIMDGVPAAAQTCKKFVEVKLPLVSVGKLCTNGMLVLFDADSVNVFNQQTRQIVAQGKRDI